VTHGHAEVTHACVDATDGLAKVTHAPVGGQARRDSSPDADPV
jgi:hypothetical protein